MALVERRDRAGVLQMVCLFPNRHEAIAEIGQDFNRRRIVLLHKAIHRKAQQSSDVGGDFALFHLQSGKDTEQHFLHMKLFGGRLFDLTSLMRYLSQLEVMNGSILKCNQHLNSGQSTQNRLAAILLFPVHLDPPAECCPLGGVRNLLCCGPQ